jgi:hypothetical protein
MIIPFTTWVREVDDACKRLAHVSIHDLSAVDLADLYDRNFTPRNAALEALKADGADPELFT